MPLELIRNDITDLQVDAVVNAANSRLQRGGGVCGAIFARADAEKLQKACDRIGFCPVGDAVITPSFGLKAPFIIHTAGPVWQGGAHGEEALLRSCYRSSLDIALAHGLRTVAFPLLSSGIFGYPKQQALSAAVSAIGDWLLNTDTDMTVYLVLYDKTAFDLGSTLHARVRAFIDERYVEEHAFLRRNRPEEIARQLADTDAETDDTEIIFDDVSSESAGDADDLDIFGKTFEFDLDIPYNPNPDGAHDVDAGFGPEGLFTEESALAAKRITDEDLLGFTDGDVTYAESDSDEEDDLSGGDMFSKSEWDCFSGDEFLTDGEDVSDQSAPPADPPAAAVPDESLRPRNAKLFFRPAATASAPSPRSLEDLLNQSAETFPQMLFRLIDERGMSDPEVYKRANLDRKLFSKIRSNPNYQPAKSTVLALSVSLRLNIDQTTDLLRRAGYALSPSSPSDLIVEYFIREEIYNIHELNETLFAFKQKLLGAQAG